MSTTSTAKTCDCGNDEFLFVKDLNLDKAWKRGNQYCRMCSECGTRFFLAKSVWKQVSDQWVILDGEDDPIPLFECPSCGEQCTGWPDSCPYCDIEFQWEDAPDRPDDPADPDEDGEDELDEDDAEFETATEVEGEADADDPDEIEADEEVEADA